MGGDLYAFLKKEAYRREKRVILWFAQCILYEVLWVLGIIRLNSDYWKKYRGH